VKALDLESVGPPRAFVIIRHREVVTHPLTIADFDAGKGPSPWWCRLGMTTKDMMNIPKDSSFNLVGPLGIASHVEKLGTVVMVGGGLGIAPIFPQLRAFKEAGNKMISIIGFRNKDLVFWEDKFRKHSDELIITTDDGSYGEKGLVSQPLQRLLEQRKDEIKMVVAIGPGIMMRVCCDVTRPFGVKTSCPEHHHGGRDGDVRFLPRVPRPRCEVRLRGRPRLRRPPRELGRAHAADETFPKGGDQVHAGTISAGDSHCPSGSTA
jgi:NAD(P)H-flavin reductase